MPSIDNLGTVIHYEIAGSGPPLVLQHGRLGSGRFWFDCGYIEPLAEDRTVIAIDARGHGRSDKPHDPSCYTARDMASDVVAVLDDVDAIRADFLGYSMGGRIGFASVAFYPDRFNTLIAGGAGPQGPARSSEAELLLAESLSNGMESYLSAMDTMLKRITPEPDRSRLLANDAPALAALARGTAEWTDVGDLVASAALPTLLFGGTADPIWPLIEGADHRFPASELRAFPGLGHGEDLRSPKLVLPVVLDFLQRHGLGAS